MLKYHLRAYFEDCWNTEHSQDIFLMAKNRQEAMEACLVLVMQIINEKCWEMTHVEVIDVIDTRN